MRDGRRSVRRRRDSHELDRLVASRVDLTAEPAEAARDGEALAALVFSGRVLGGGDGGRRGLLQRLAVGCRAAREDGVDAGRGVGLSHI